LADGQSAIFNLPIKGHGKKKGEQVWPIPLKFNCCLSG
jgi:hypothetical protein